MKIKILVIASLMLSTLLRCDLIEGRDKPPRANRVQLLETGEFHGEEVSAKTGERWLGVHVSEQGSLLLPYRLTVKAVHDPIIGEDDSQKTGKAVSVDLPLEPVFLVRAPMLSEGPIKTTFNQPLNYEKGFERFDPISLRLGETEYVLKGTGGENPVKCRDHSFPKNAKLVLVSGKVEQVLYSLDDCGNDPNWYLLWAGDLDRDGKLDLYASVNQHYNVSERRLFLSSQAKKGELVKEVAEFVTSGC